MKYLSVLFAFSAIIGSPSGAQTLPPADIYVLGEVHDDAGHHVEQARIVAELRPAAAVFEQLTDEQADRISPDTTRTADVLGPMLDWADSGWPDIAMYAPIMAASDAVILGAAGAPGDLSAFGLDTPLRDEEQSIREDLQAEAHCDALPEAMLPEFVTRQRTTDALFAARTISAFDAHGGPVVLITGNGHARTDWGVPAAIARARPELTISTLVQGPEGSTPPADVTRRTAAVERPDPCAAFR